MRKRFTVRRWKVGRRARGMDIRFLHYSLETGLCFGIGIGKLEEAFSNLQPSVEHALNPQVARLGKDAS